MPHIEAEIVVDAPRESVWNVLIDLPKWETWNPFIVKAEGSPQVGNSLKLKFNNGMGFKPVVEVAEPNTKLQWLGKLGWGGIFDGRHMFELSDVSEGGTKKTLLRQSEDFSGCLVPLVPGVLADTKKNFASLNEALKRQVESSVKQ